MTVKLHRHFLKSFLNRYLSNYGNAFCGVMDAPIPYKDEEVHSGWLNNDIAFTTNGNWFTILFGGEAESTSHGY